LYVHVDGVKINLSTWRYIPEDSEFRNVVFLIKLRRRIASTKFIVLTTQDLSGCVLLCNHNMAFYKFSFIKCV